MYKKYRFIFDGLEKGCIFAALNKNDNETEHSK